jgi:hypothetical protein
MRKQVAGEILDPKSVFLSPRGRTDFNTLRCRTLFATDLKNALELGTLSHTLHACLTTVRQRLLPDTQNQEGKHRELQAIVTSAPSISLPLLSARATLKTSINETARLFEATHHCNHRDAKQLAISELVNVATMNLGCVDEVLGDSDRWDAPSPKPVESGND